jgi:hypothetical protein
MASSWFSGQHATILITMDEGVTSTAGGQVPMVAISNKARARGAVSGFGNHFGTLRSIEGAYGLSFLGGAATSANGDIRYLFG